MRPTSIGGPAYCSNVGNTEPTDVVDAGNETADPARTAPGPAVIVPPSRVTSCVQVPLYARARSMYVWTIARQVVAPS